MFVYNSRNPISVRKYCLGAKPILNGLEYSTDPELRKYGIAEAEKGIKRGKRDKTRKKG